MTKSKFIYAPVRASTGTYFTMVPAELLNDKRTGKTVKVIKANKVIEIDESQLNGYLNQGYTLQGGE